MATRTAEDTHWWFENAQIKFRIGVTLTFDQIRVADLTWRNVMYFYPYLTYGDGLVPVTQTTFYLNSIGDWTLTEGPEPSGSATVSLVATKTYVAGDGTEHSFTVTISLTDGDNFAKVVFEDETDATLHNPTIALESNVFPQGYDAQNTGGNVSMGGVEDVSAPLPYDDITYVVTSVGTLTPGKMMTDDHRAVLS
jgi:hypothetical protein